MLICRDCQKIHFSYNILRSVNVSRTYKRSFTYKEFYDDQDDFAIQKEPFKCFTFHDDESFMEEMDNKTDDIIIMCPAQEIHKDIELVDCLFFSEEEIDYLIQLRGNKDYINFKDLSAVDGIKLRKILNIQEE